MEKYITAQICSKETFQEAVLTTHLKAETAFQNILDKRGPSLV